SARRTCCRPASCATAVPRPPWTFWGYPPPSRATAFPPAVPWPPSGPSAFAWRVPTNPGWPAGYGTEFTRGPWSKCWSPCRGPNTPCGWWRRPTPTWHASGRVKKSGSRGTAGMWSSLRERLAGLLRRPGLRVFLMAAPMAAWLLVFQVVPLALVVVTSFATRGTYGGVVYRFGLHNYVRFLDPLYLEIFADSFVVAGTATVICLLVGYPFAYFVASRPAPLRHVLLLLVVIPFWTNMLTRTYAWMIILRGNGLLNQALMALGLISEPIDMLYTRGASILGLVYVLLPFMVLPLYASIEKLDPRMVQA